MFPLRSITVKPLQESRSDFLHTVSETGEPETAQVSLSSSGGSWDSWCTAPDEDLKKSILICSIERGIVLKK
uniref:Uncharacterized protein n=1 Tax=Cucumis sativus TaxID=3659 RepID=A0A0A0KUR5_CUCSA